MKVKRFITAILLLFIVVSIAFIFIKENKVSNTQTNNTQTSNNANVEVENTPTSMALNESPKLVAYYFHGNRRCATCKTIESFTREAVERGFSEKLKNGQVEIRVVNVENTNNEHFVKDYALTTRSVVVSLENNGIEKRWRRLDRVWELVGDKAAFIEYIQKSMNFIMKEAVND